MGTTAKPSRRTALAAGLAGLLLAACVEIPIGNQSVDLGKVFGGGAKLVQSFTPVSDPREREIGEAVSLKLVQAMGGLEENEPLTRYLTLILRAVARNGDRPQLDYRVGVVRTVEVNAFATPGGMIFVTRGLLNNIRSEAELAGILSHECEHVCERHMLKEIQRAKGMEGLGDLSASTGSAQTREKAQALFGGIDSGYQSLVSKGFDRKDELEADRLGAELAWAAGYDPYAYAEFLSRLGQLVSANPGWSLSQTHPSPADRAEAVREHLQQKHPALAANALPRLEARYQKRGK